MAKDIAHKAQLHKSLLLIVAEIERFIKYQVHYTDTARSIKEHVAIYQEKHGAEWPEKIPLGSFHLPVYESGNVCRALDFKVWDKEEEKWLPGDVIACMVMVIKDRFKIKGGMGIGKEFIHIDIRSYDVNPWRYS